MLQLPAPAAAHQRVSETGGVRATVNWRGSNGQFSDYRITIVRRGVTLVDEPMKIQRDFDEPLRPGHHKVAVRDLERDGEPEILVDASTNGAHCCNTTKLWYFKNGAYRTVEHFFANADYTRGATLLVGVADWSYIFGCYVCSASPVMVLDARLRNVTAKHPRIVERDLRKWRREYASYGSRAVLAAIVADLHSLGCHDAADATVRRAMRHGVLRQRGKYDSGPFEQEYLQALGQLLDEGGYRSRNKDRAVSTICGS